jgi:hypothetical protein
MLEHQYYMLRITWYLPVIYLQFNAEDKILTYMYN